MTFLTVAGHSFSIIYPDNLHFRIYENLVPETDSPVHSADPRVNLQRTLLFKRTDWSPVNGLHNFFQGKPGWEI